MLGDGTVYQNDSGHPVVSHFLEPFFFSLLFWKYLFIYLAAPGLSCGTRDLCCHVRDLVPWPGIEPGPPALVAQSLTHWITREVPNSPSSVMVSICPLLHGLTWTLPLPPTATPHWSQCPASHPLTTVRVNNKKIELSLLPKEKDTFPSLPFLPFIRAFAGEKNIFKPYLRPFDMYINLLKSSGQHYNPQMFFLKA